MRGVSGEGGNGEKECEKGLTSRKVKKGGEGEGERGEAREEEEKDRDGNGRKDREKDRKSSYHRVDGRRLQVLLIDRGKEKCTTGSVFHQSAHFTLHISSTHTPKNGA